MRRYPGLITMISTMTMLLFLHSGLTMVENTRSGQQVQPELVNWSCLQSIKCLKLLLDKAGIKPEKPVKLTGDGFGRFWNKKNTNHCVQPCRPLHSTPAAYLVRQSHGLKERDSNPAVNYAQLCCQQAPTTFVAFDVLGCRKPKENERIRNKRRVTVTNERESGVVVRVVKVYKIQMDVLMYV